MSDERRTPVSARLRRERAAVSAIFFVHGAVFASWAARVPAVQEELHLPAGVLGLVLAGPGLGALAGSQAGGLLVRRLGSRAVSALAPVVLSVPLGLIPTARSAPWLLGLLVLLGAADGCTSVAMNARAVVVQRWYGRSVLNSMHAIRSVGAMAGGLAGVATTSAALTLTTQFVVMAVVLAAVSAVAACGLGPESGMRPSSSERPVRRRPRGEGARPHRRMVIFLLAVMTFLASLAEDAPASWSGVYLRHVGAGAAMAAAGYAAFSAGEVIMRLSNDRLVNRLGWARLIRGGTACCAAALAGALLLGRPGVMLGALVVAGAGISAVFPGAFTAAGALDDPAVAMGQVGFAGNLGWLLVSPMIGGLATVVGLSWALGLLVVAALVISALAPVTRPRPPARDGPRPAARRARGPAERP